MTIDEGSEDVFQSASPSARRRAAVAKIRAARAGGAEVNLVVSADQDVPHGRVVHVIDVAKVEGVSKFSINVEQANLIANTPPEGIHPSGDHPSLSSAPSCTLGLGRPGLARSAPSARRAARPRSPWRSRKRSLRRRSPSTRRLRSRLPRSPNRCVRPRPKWRPRRPKPAAEAPKLRGVARDDSIPGLSVSRSAAAAGLVASRFPPAESVVADRRRLAKRAGTGPTRARRSSSRSRSTTCADPIVKARSPIDAPQPRLPTRLQRSEGIAGQACAFEVSVDAHGSVSSARPALRPRPRARRGRARRGAERDVLARDAGAGRPDGDDVRDRDAVLARIDVTPSPCGAMRRARAAALGRLAGAPRLPVPSRAAAAPVDQLGRAQASRGLPSSPLPSSRRLIPESEKRAAGRTATVVLQVAIAAKRATSADDVTVLQSAGPAFDAAALAPCGSPIPSPPRSTVKPSPIRASFTGS